MWHESEIFTQCHSPDTNVNKACTSKNYIGTSKCERIILILFE